MGAAAISAAVRNSSSASPACRPPRPSTTKAASNTFAADMRQEEAAINASNRGARPRGRAPRATRTCPRSLGQPLLVIEHGAVLPGQSPGPISAAHRSALRRMARRRASAPWRFDSRAKRSRSASVIAPVLVVPVSLASSLAKRHVSSFLMLRPISTTPRVESESALYQAAGWWFPIAQREAREAVCWRMAQGTDDGCDGRCCTSKLSALPAGVKARPFPATG